MALGKAVEIALLMGIVLALAISLYYMQNTLQFIHQEYNGLKKSIFPTIAGSSYTQIAYPPSNKFTMDPGDNQKLVAASAAVMSVYNLSQKKDPELPPYMKQVATLGVHGAVFNTPDAVVIVYRGTIDSKDVLADLLATQTPYVDPTGRLHKQLLVHRGFHSIWLQGMTERQRFHLDLLRSKRPLIITGHSLGGALAAFEALALLLSGYRGSIQLVTFGAPKVGNQAFVEALEKHWIAVKNKNDVIPLLPPPVFTFAGETWTYSEPTHHTIIDAQEKSIRRNHCISTYASAAEQALRLVAAPLTV